MQALIRNILISFVLYGFIGSVDMHASGDRDLIQAVIDGNIGQIGDLLDAGVNPNIQQPDTGYTPLIIAAVGNNVDMVRLLLRYEADLDIMDNDSMTALMYAAQEDHVAICKLLIDRGALVDYADRDGDTALIFASRSGSDNTVKMLLKQNANTNHRNKKGETALLAAIERKHEDVVRVFLNEGVQLKDFSEIRLAARIRGNSAIQQMIEDYYQQSFMILLQAAQDGDLNKIRRMVALGVPIDVQDRDDGTTALMYAIQHGHGTVIKFLLDAGAEIDIKDDFGNTALILASAMNQLMTVSLLLKMGADWSITNHAGQTAKSVTQDIRIISLIDVYEKASAGAA